MTKQPQKKKDGKRKSQLRYDDEYIAYVENGESAAVFIARDLVKEINTQGKWIDVVYLDGEKNYDKRWDFDKIVVELFPRRTKPDYSAAIGKEDMHYITWLTATKDIQDLRQTGYKGPQWEIHPRLVRNKNRRYRTVKKWWNPRFERYVPKKWGVEGCELRKVKEPIDPKWIYSIQSVKKCKTRY